MNWNVLCYHPYFIPMLFADLLSLHLTTFLMFFFFLLLFMSLFFSARCMMSWSLPSVPEQKVSPHRLPMQYWLKNHWLSSNTPHTDGISNSAILRINYILLLSEEKWHPKGSHSYSVSGLYCLVSLQTCKKAISWCTAQWKMLLFCAKTIVKESCKFELARLKKNKNKKKEKHFGCLATFWFGTFAMFFSATGYGVRHENTQRWTVGCYNG